MTNVSVRRPAGGPWAVAALPGVLAAAALGGVVALAPVTTAHADDLRPESVSAASRYQVTMAARACPGYTQIMANRVRDDQIEAAAMPGRDSAYTDGQAVDPDVEARNGIGCTPLTGWRFTFGGGREKKGALSTVSPPAGEAGPTAADTPRLDPTGKPTDKTLAGAVTVDLTDDQLRSAMRRQLWVQGGSPGDPLLAKDLPGYGFGVLRCAVDGREGGNVQWIGFPPGVRHVFCFAYYVASAAPAATLILRTKTTRPVGYPQRFTFDASASYSATRTVTVDTAGDAVDTSFLRTAGGTAQRLLARLPADWRLADLGCAASGAGKSAVAVDMTTGRAEVTLSGGEIVTCTYTFEPPPARPGLTLRVYSDAGGGQFGLTVSGVAGPAALQATPRGDGSAVVAGGTDLGGALPGQYTVTVSPPANDAWSLAGANCGGSEVKPAGLAITITVSPGTALDCVLRMAHKPGAITLRAVTVGGVGAAAFAVVPLGQGAPGWSAVATTTGYGVPANAAGDLPAGLAFDVYLVTPLAPRATADGSWRLSSFTCDPESPGGKVTLAPGTAGVDCTATYQLVPATRLHVTLRFTGEPAGRGGAAAVEVSCVDGSHGRVVLGADDMTEQSLPTPLGFSEPTRCTLGQPIDPTSGDGTATVSAVLDPAPGNAPLSLPAVLDVTRDIPDYTVTITITFKATVDGPNRSTVLNNFNVLPVALIGAGLVGLGLVILLVMVVRSRDVSARY